MDEIIATLIATGFGSGIAFLTTYLNNKSQTQREIRKSENDFKIEKYKIDSDARLKYQMNISKHIEEASLIVCKIQHSISLTKSVIDASEKLNFQNFDQNYLIEIKKLSRVESKALIYFSQVYEKVRTLVSLYNNYWGQQRLLLMCDLTTEYQGYKARLIEIIQIAEKAYTIIEKIKGELLNIGNEILNSDHFQFGKASTSQQK